MSSSQRNDYLTTAVCNNFPIRIDTFDTLLTAHPDRVKVNYTVGGLRDGFRIGLNSANVHLRSAEVNCWSALAHPDVIDRYLAGEIQAHRVAGPFDVPPWPNLHVSRFGVIPNKNKPDSWRLILDLSFPLNHSVNDGISKSDFPVNYSTVQDAIRLIV